MSALILAVWFACTPIDDPVNGTRYFQQEPCAPGYVHSPLPPEPVPFLRPGYDPEPPIRWGDSVMRYPRGCGENLVRSKNHRGRRR